MTLPQPLSIPGLLRYVLHGDNPLPVASGGERRSNLGAKLHQLAGTTSLPSIFVLTSYFSPSLGSLAQIWCLPSQATEKDVEELKATELDSMSTIITLIMEAAAILHIY